MLYLKIWFSHVVKIDCLYKINLSNSYNIPFINKIVLNIHSLVKNDSLFNVLYSITALILITNQKPIISKVCKSIKLIKSKTNSFVNIKLTLRKVKAFEFLSTIIFLLTPHIKINSTNLTTVNSFSVGLNNISIFPQLTGYFNKFLFENIVFSINFNVLSFYTLRFLISSLHICSK